VCTLAPRLVRSSHLHHYFPLPAYFNLCPPPAITQARPKPAQSGTTRAATLRFVPDLRPISFDPASGGAVPIMPRNHSALASESMVSTHVSSVFASPAGILLGEGPLQQILEADPRFSAIACVATEPSRPWRILAVNRAWSEATGFSATEAVGNTCRMLQGPDTSIEAKDALHQACTMHSPICLRLVNYDKRGMLFPNLLRVAPARRKASAASALGEVTCLIAAVIREGAMPSTYLSLTPSPHATPRVEPPSGARCADGECNVAPPLSGSMLPPPVPTQRLGTTWPATLLPTPPQLHPNEVFSDARLAVARSLANTAQAPETSASEPLSQDSTDASCRSSLSPTTSQPWQRAGSLGAGNSDGRLSCRSLSGLSSLAGYRSISGLSELSDVSEIDVAADFQASGHEAAERGSSAATPTRPAPFLTKVQQILECPESAAAIKWTVASNGSPAFVVLDQSIFAKDVLPRFYKHNKISSFVQQLYTYGFRRAELAADTTKPTQQAEVGAMMGSRSLLAFQHDQFQPGRYDLLVNIKRAAPSRSGSADHTADKATVAEAAVAAKELDDLDRAVHELQESYRAKLASDVQRLGVLWHLIQARQRDEQTAASPQQESLNTLAKGFQPVQAAATANAQNVSIPPPNMAAIPAEAYRNGAPTYFTEPSTTVSYTNLSDTISCRTDGTNLRPSAAASAVSATKDSCSSCTSKHAIATDEEAANDDDETVTAESSDTAESLASTSNTDSCSRSDAGSVTSTYCRSALSHANAKRQKRSKPGGSVAAATSATSLQDGRQREARRKPVSAAEQVQTNAKRQCVRAGRRGVVDGKRRTAQPGSGQERESSPHDSVEL